MSEIKWARPTSTKDVVRLLQTESDARLHGGGTGLLRQRLRHGTLIDLSRTGLRTFSATDDHFLLGAGATFTDVVKGIGAVEPDHVLVNALGSVAAPALRNRITVGGSLAMSPPWSGLLGPLVALDATAAVAGIDGNDSVVAVPVEAYLRERKNHHGTVVTEVQVPRTDECVGWWYRLVRMHFDYAPFSLTVAGTPSDGTLRNARVVIVGTTNRFDRLTALEATLADDRGLAAFTDPARQIAPEELPVTIPARNGFSSEYLAEMARVQLERGLRAMAEQYA